MTFRFPPRLALPFLLATFAATAGAQPLRPAPPASSASVAPALPGTRAPIVVTVGDVAIRADRVDTLATLMARARGADLDEVPAEQAMMLRRVVTTNLIGQELLELEAKSRGIQARAQEIDSAVALLKSQFPDAASWQRAMRQSGDSEAGVRAKVARQIRSEKVLAAGLEAPGPASEAELRAFWEQNKDQFPVNDSLRALQILLIVDAKAPAEEAAGKKRRLEALRRDLLADSADTPQLLRRFMNEAARNGEGPEARIGGDLERFHPDDFHASFKGAVAGLNVGDLSPVFRTPLGFHLVMLIEKFDGRFESYRLQTMQNLAAQKNVRLAEDMRDFLKKLAARHSVKYQRASYRDTSENGIY